MTSDTDLDDLFEKLDTAIKNEQHKRAIKACDEILALAPKDEDALLCKIVANVQLAQYDAALSLIAKHGQTLGDKVMFEKAYSLYRFGKIEEALEVAQAGEAAHPQACLQLMAQLHYRLGQSKDTIKAYDKLFKEHKEDSLELKTNVVAAYVMSELSKEVPGLMSAMQVNTKQSFEIGFNKACALLDLGDFAAAETELRMALKTGREALFEEDCAEEEVEQELAPVTVQLGYALGRQGRAQEAVEIYEQVLANTGITDDIVRAIAHNNNIAESGKIDSSAAQKKHVANAAKRMEGLLDRDKPAPLKLSPALESRLSCTQKQTLHLNRALLYLLSGRYDHARETAAAVARQYGESTSLVLLRAALLAAEGKYQEADAHLEAGSGNALRPTLMRAQLALEAGGGAAGMAKALEILSNLPPSPEGEDIANSGAVLASRLALHQQLGDNVGAEAMLDAALAHWKQPAAAAATTPKGTKGSLGSKAASSSSTALGWCLQGLVGLKLKLGKVDEAIKCYQQLLQAGGGGGKAQLTAASVGVLGRLIRAVATSDPKAAVQMEKELPGVSPVQVGGVDIDLLENQSKDVGTFKKKEGRKREGGEADMADQQKKKRRRKRKPMLPKGYDPLLPSGGLPAPNPERWLPKWQRSEFKKKKVTSAQRKSEVVKGSQGAGKVDENLDRSAAAAPSPPPASQSAKPTLPARKAKGKK